MVIPKSLVKIDISGVFVFACSEVLSLEVISVESSIKVVVSSVSCSDKLITKATADTINISNKKIQY